VPALARRPGRLHGRSSRRGAGERRGALDRQPRERCPCPPRLLRRIGSSLFWDAPEGETISIAAGTLDLPTGLKTVEQIYTADASDYYDLD